MINGSKGIFFSAIVILFGIFLLLFGIGKVVKTIVRRLFDDNINFLIIIFLAFYFIRILLLDINEVVYHFRIFVLQVIPMFILGIISFSNFKSVSKEVNIFVGLLYNPKYYLKLYIALQIILLLYFVQIIPQLISSYVSNAVTLMTINTEYYQVIGDYFIIVFMFITSIKLNIYEMYKHKKWSYIYFVLISIIEFIIYTIYLQILGSNKTPLMLFLITIFIIVVYKPKFRITKKQLLAFAIVFIGSAIFLISSDAILQNLNLQQFRIFNSDQGGGSILENQSLMIRIEQVLGLGLHQINTSPIWGDLSIIDYMHSTLISTQTHLGIVGFILLWGFITLKLIKIYIIERYNLLLWISVSVIFVSILSSVFYWGPFWFIIGGLYSFTKKSKQVRYSLNHV